jgi:hypothetical protein
MKSRCAAAFALSAIAGIHLALVPVLAQEPQQLPAVSATPSEVVLDWTPPALAALSAQAAAKSSFTLDRTMLAAAAGVTGGIDDATRQAIAKLDGVSVHVLRFADAGLADPAQIEAIRQAYRQSGWKHMVATASGGSALHNAATDVWVVMDGANLRGAVVLVESPRSLTLATVKGDLSPLDLLHLRGHFGIPRFEGDGLAGDK